MATTQKVQIATHNGAAIKDGSPADTFGDSPAVRQQFLRYAIPTKIPLDAQTSVDTKLQRIVVPKDTICANIRWHVHGKVHVVRGGGQAHWSPKGLGKLFSRFHLQDTSNETRYDCPSFDLVADAMTSKPWGGGDPGFAAVPSPNFGRLMHYAPPLTNGDHDFATYFDSPLAESGTILRGILNLNSSKSVTLEFRLNDIAGDTDEYPIRISGGAGVDLSSIKIQPVMWSYVSTGQETPNGLAIPELYNDYLVIRKVLHQSQQIGSGAELKAEVDANLTVQKILQWCYLNGDHSFGTVDPETGDTTFGVDEAFFITNSINKVQSPRLVDQLQDQHSGIGSDPPIIVWMDRDWDTVTYPTLKAGMKFTPGSYGDPGMSTMETATVAYIRTAEATPVPTG